MFFFFIRHKMSLFFFMKGIRISETTRDVLGSTHTSHEDPRFHQPTKVLVFLPLPPSPSAFLSPTRFSTLLLSIVIVEVVSAPLSLRYFMYNFFLHNRPKLCCAADAKISTNILSHSKNQTRSSRSTKTIA